MTSNTYNAFRCADPKLHSEFLKAHGYPRELEPDEFTHSIVAQIRDDADKLVAFVWGHWYDPAMELLMFHACSHTSLRGDIRWLLQTLPRLYEVSKFFEAKGLITDPEDPRLGHLMVRRLGFVRRSDGLFLKEF